MKAHSQDALIQARKAFQNNEYDHAREKLKQVEQEHLSNQVNLHLIELFIRKDQTLDILKKLLDVLTRQNFQLINQNRPKEIKYIPYELLYWNIMVLASWNAQFSLVDLVGNQALFFYQTFQPSTSLKIIAEKLKVHLAQNRLATCFSLYEKFQKVFDHNRKMSTENQRYKTLINLLFTKALAKMGMIEEAQSMFMMKFGENEREAFFYVEEKGPRRKQEIYASYDDMINFLHTEIQFATRNYQKCIGLLGPFLNQKISYQKALAENNLAVVLTQNGKHSAAAKVFSNAAEALYKLIPQKKPSPQTIAFHEKVKENMIISYMMVRDKKSNCTHSTLQYDQKYYNQMKKIQDFHSYKQYYRKGELCLNFYHSLLQKNCQRVPYDEIHDNYETVYFNPNVAYFQFKGGKNKNPSFTNKKVSNRRYLLPDHSISPSKDFADKDSNRRKFEKQAVSLKQRQILDNAKESFQKALMILQNEKSIVIRMDGMQKQTGKTLTEKLFHEHAKFEASLLCLLAYVQLCRKNWGAVLRYSRQFQSNKYNEKESDNYYCVLNYKMEALFELDRGDEAYLCAHEILNFQPSKTVLTESQDGSSLWNEMMGCKLSQEILFLYNLAVLHSRENRMPESHNAIQKLLQEMNKIPNHPRVDMPLPLIELLIHYNLRINNLASALQLIKRRRILTGATPAKQVLSITK